jgi:hypothetical protein
MSTPENTMTLERELPKDPEALADLLDGAADAAAAEAIRERLRTQEGMLATSLLSDAGRVRRRRRRTAAAKAVRDAERAAKIEAGTYKPRGRFRVGVARPTAGSEGYVRSADWSIKLRAGVTDAVDRLAARMTLENQLNGGPAVSRNDVVRFAIDEFIANPPKGEDISFASLYGELDEKFSFLPGGNQMTQLDDILPGILAQVGRAGMGRQRIHLIRHAVDVYLAKHRGPGLASGS